MKSILTLWAVGLISFPIYAATSPFATNTTGIPLNQSTTDDINGILVTSPNVPQEGSLTALTDATSSSSPTGNVTFGTVDENAAPVGLTWDFGTSLDAALRRLSTVSIWFATDPDRAGFNGSLATSLDGIIFTDIDNSSHSAQFDFTPGLFHNVFYNFSGTNVSNFRYIRITSLGYTFPTPPGLPALQPRFVEVDITVVPEPSTFALLACGAGCLGFSIYRKTRRN